MLLMNTTISLLMPNLNYITMQKLANEENPLVEKVSGAEKSVELSPPQQLVEKSNMVVSETETSSLNDEKMMKALGEHVAEANAVAKAKIPKQLKKNFEPPYSKEQVIELTKVTQVMEGEIQAIFKNPNIIKFPFGSHNCVIDLTAFINKGGDVVTPKVNREHGKDMSTTGESIMMYGPQHLAICIPIKVAKAAGMESERFSNDTSTTPISENALVVLDGNGRINYNYGLPQNERPHLYATLPEPDALGLYNPRKIMEIINTELRPWKAQDWVIKRQLEDGVQAHQGWMLIQELVNKGYNYQAACQAYTLDTDRITKKEVTAGEDRQIFVHFDSAKKIHDALVAKFNEGVDKTLKTKEFPKEVSILWHKLLNFKGENWATDTFIKFINCFEDVKVLEILNAKSDKNGMNKDQKRKKILDEQFEHFLTKQNIKLG